MLFDEDTTLLSFFENFSDAEDEQELKENIIKYVGGGNFGASNNISEENTTGESLDEVSKNLLKLILLLYKTNLSFLKMLRCRPHRTQQWT